MKLFSPPFFSDSKKIDEFHHAKKVLPENPISSLVVKCFFQVHPVIGNSVKRP